MHDQHQNPLPDIQIAQNARMLAIAEVAHRKLVFWKLVLFASAFALVLTGCSSSDHPETPPGIPTGASDTPTSAPDANGYQVIQVPDGGSITGTIKVTTGVTGITAGINSDNLPRRTNEWSFRRKPHVPEN